MKVAKRISDGKISYRSEPDFAEGNGILNSIALFGGDAEDYEEVEITEEQWEAAEKMEI